MNYYFVNLSRPENEIEYGFELLRQNETNMVFQIGETVFVEGAKAVFKIVDIQHQYRQLEDGRLRYILTKVLIEIDQP